MRQKAIELQAKIRSLKATGMTYDDIAGALGTPEKPFTRQMAAYYGRPGPTERLCECCLQPLQKAKV